MKSKYASKCPKCERDWAVGDEIFMSKSSDGNTWIKCSDKECFESQGGKISEGGGKKPFVSQKFPITEVPQIFCLAETLLDSFKTKRHLIQTASNTFNVNGTSETITTDLNIEKFEPLTTSEELQAVESFFKSILGGCKP